MSDLADLPPLPSPSVADSLSLLSCTTASAPALTLSQHDTNILSDLFPSMRALNQAVCSQEGQVVIADYLGEEVTRGLVAFWQQDCRYE